jgi:two-component system OmpR family sensor kinase
VTVTVATEAGRVLLEVADQGPGMAAEHAARAFERFYRADASRTRQTGGNGLGLAIVLAIVAAHDGTVDLVTAPGEGATVRVRLPAPAVPPAAHDGQPVGEVAA